MRDEALQFATRSWSAKSNTRESEGIAFKGILLALPLGASIWAGLGWAVWALYHTLKP